MSRASTIKLNFNLAALFYQLRKDGLFDQVGLATATSTQAVGESLDLYLNDLVELAPKSQAGRLNPFSIYAHPETAFQFNSDSNCFLYGCWLSSENWLFGV